MNILSLYVSALFAVKTWRICRKSSLIQISPLPQPQTGHREIAADQDVKPHKCSQYLYFNKSNRHVYLLEATLIFFLAK